MISRHNYSLFVLVVVSTLLLGCTSDPPTADNTSTDGSASAKADGKVASDPELPADSKKSVATEEPVGDRSADTGKQESPKQADTTIVDAGTLQGVVIPDVPDGLELKPTRLGPKGKFLTIDLPTTATFDGSEIRLNEEARFTLTEVNDPLVEKAVEEVFATYRAVKEPGKVVVDTPNLVISGFAASGFDNFNTLAVTEIDGRKYAIQSVYQPGYKSAVTIAVIARSLRKSSADFTAEKQFAETKQRLLDLGCEYNGRFGSNALYLKGPDVSDADLEFAKHLQPTTWLDISSTKVTPACLKHFAQAPSISTVHLTGDTIGGDWLAPLADFPSLDSLIVEGGPIQGDAWSGLGKIQQLRELKVRVRADIFCAKAIAQLSKLYWLELEYVALTDDCVKELRFPNKEDDIYLCLSGNDITDASLAHLQTISNLDHLVVKETKITQEGIAKFKAALPRCRVDK